MKTNWFRLKRGGLLPMLMAAILFLTTLGCEEDLPEITGSYEGDILTKSFTVLPEGTTVKAFNETVTLEFPGGTVNMPTDFTLESYPLKNLDMKGINIMTRGVSLKNNQPEHDIYENITITMAYNLGQFKEGTPVQAGDLTIYKIAHDFKTFTKCESIGDCCVDPSTRQISGCFFGCGFLVVGEK